MPPANLEVGGVQVEIGIALLLKRALPPVPLLPFKPRGDPDYGVLANPHPTQSVSDARHLAHRDPGEVHLKDRLFDVSAHPLVAFEEVRNELALAVARHRKAPNLTCFFYGDSSSGIVLLRAYGADVEAKASLVADVLETHKAELTMDPPHFAVLRRGRLMRSRSLPRPRDRRVRTSGIDPAIQAVESLASVGEVRLFDLVVARGFGRYGLLARWCGLDYSG